MLVAKDLNRVKDVVVGRIIWLSAIGATMSAIRASLSTIVVIRVIAITAIVRIIVVVMVI